MRLLSLWLAYSCSLTGYCDASDKDDIMLLKYELKMVFIRLTSLELRKPSFRQVFRPWGDGNSLD